MKLTLIVFRHGETSFNKDKIFCGWINAPLNETGIAQAKALGKKLKDEKIDCGFCSDQVRGMQTLAAVLEYHQKAKVIIDHRIRERNYGIFTGHSKIIFKQIFPRYYEEVHRGYHTAIPGGENFFQVGKRVFPFMNDLVKFMRENKCNVAISAHGNSMRLIQEYLENLSHEETSKLENSPAAYKKYCLNF
ncbi:MAG: histidine phosphatase family protein [Candidatus Diapherotrites archaeon]|nr:histidine phosphatase family protein [Candidatus Diapherotrites archaeon]